MMNAMMQETLLDRHRAQGRAPRLAGGRQDRHHRRISATPGSSATPAHLVAGVWLGNDDSSPTKKTTGGGLPVDIWSRFMKAAHQGVPVAALPGVSSAPLTASVFPPFSGSRPTPPAPIAGSGRTGASGLG